MKRTVDLIFPTSLYAALMSHLFPGDFGEHGAVVVAGWIKGSRGPRLLARELWIARDGVDYLPSAKGYLALQAPFIHRAITHCRDRGLVYLAAHNHGGRSSVGFSGVDYRSHERGYPALLDIAGGPPVGALVFAQDAVEIDLWMPGGDRLALSEARVLGRSIKRLYSDAWSVEREATEGAAPFYDRQVLLFGDRGQRLLHKAKVAVIGLGGIGSLVSEYLARLGVGSLVLIDPDRLAPSNYSRIVGARPDDLASGGPSDSVLKVDIAHRVALEAQPGLDVETIAGDFATRSVAHRVLDCDFLFLAADSMRARLVFNAIVQQYFIPGVQLGSKVTFDRRTGRVEAAFSTVRQVRPGTGCLLCNQLIDGARLAEEWKTDAEREDQRYGTETPNPSVITMNAVSAAHAVNEFLFAFVGLRTVDDRPPYQRFDHLTGAIKLEEPRRDPKCSECSATAESRYGRGNAVPLPCAE